MLDTFGIGAVNWRSTFANIAGEHQNGLFLPLDLYKPVSVQRSSDDGDDSTVRHRDRDAGFVRLGQNGESGGSKPVGLAQRGSFWLTWVGQRCLLTTRRLWLRMSTYRRAADASVAAVSTTGLSLIS